MKHTPIRTYEPTTYAEGSYVMTPEDFADGCFIVTNAITGAQTGTGICPRGDKVTVPLYVPLCKGCDRPIIDHKCDACEAVFIDEPEPLVEVEHLGPGRIAA